MKVRERTLSRDVGVVKSNTVGDKSLPAQVTEKGEIERVSALLWGATVYLSVLSVAALWAAFERRRTRSVIFEPTQTLHDAEQRPEALRPVSETS